MLAAVMSPALVQVAAELGTCGRSSGLFAGLELGSGAHVRLASALGW